MKRYMALLVDMTGYLDEDPDGDWVRYEDAQAAIAALEKERDALSEAFNRAHERELALEKAIDEHLTRVAERLPASARAG